LADAIFIAHASAGGVLPRQSSSWASQGLQMLNLSPRQITGWLFRLGESRSPAVPAWVRWSEVGDDGV